MNCQMIYITLWYYLVLHVIFVETGTISVILFYHQNKIQVIFIHHL